jgi:hypothetical protein
LTFKTPASHSSTNTNTVISLLNNNANTSNIMSLVNSGLSNGQLATNQSQTPQINNSAANSITITSLGSYNSVGVTNNPSNLSSNSIISASTSTKNNVQNLDKNSSSSSDQIKNQSNANQFATSINSVTPSTLNKGKNMNNNVNSVEKVATSHTNLTRNSNSQLPTNTTNTPSSSNNSIKTSHTQISNQLNQHSNKAEDLIINSGQKRKREHSNSNSNQNSNFISTNNVSSNAESSHTKNLNHKPAHNDSSNLNINKTIKTIDQQTNNKNILPNSKNRISVEKISDSFTEKIHSFDSNPSFSWPVYLENEKRLSVAPVYAFKHVPLSSLWKKIMHNTNIEVANRDPPPAHLLDEAAKANNDKNFYWFASIIYFAGYLAKIRYLGFEDDSSCDFWIHMCDPNIHPVGWAAENNFLIVPPFKIVKKCSNWKDYLMKHLANKKTLPSNYHKRVS